ncbi:DNA-binding transcriptional LysR family regulator [Paenibacillus anaericanus]|uniref:LysR family transcriptional regulator n=1 Tax=Paenibacillus anaericanus TaxID=170367 RepID=UPI0027855429|nr:LysR family transcriptional regulator [Paenibacillus anaericanus]MDQ0086890.1 DNA-binding transcriptional LysR family regulator [Paenibacillus anaericanus]
MIVDTLKVFVTVVEQSNFSRAAEILNLSQPGVSLHIRNLENEFGVKLLHRSSKLVKMTEAGHILYVRAKQILSQYEAASEEISLLRNEVTGSLIIGASFTIGEYILPRLLSQFVNQYPQVDIQVKIANTEEIAHGIHNHELDIGLVEGETEYPEIQLNPPFMEDEMVLVAHSGHPLTSFRNLNSSMLHDLVWVFRESGSGTRAFSDQFIENLGLHVKRSFVFNSSQGVKEAVIAGLGVAMLSRLVIHKELESGDLQSIQLNEQRLSRNFYVLQDPKSSLDTMAVKMFLQKLRQFEN